MILDNQKCPEHDVKYTGCSIKSYTEEKKGFGSPKKTAIQIPRFCCRVQCYVRTMLPLPLYIGHGL